MTTSHSQRIANIFLEAVKLGFEFETGFSDNDGFSDVVLEAEDYIIANTDIPAQVEVELRQEVKDQFYFYADGMGYTYEEQGHIVDWSAYQDGQRIRLKQVVNSLGQAVQLYAIK